MAQSCASCQQSMREDDTVSVLEDGDVVCEPCADTVREYDEDLIAYTRKLRDVHEDWRT